MAQPENARGRRRIRKLPALVLLVGIAAAGAWLRGLDRAVLRTGLASGEPREVSLWVAEEGLHLWLEAPSADLAWYRAMQGDPLVELRYRGRIERFRAEAMPQEAARIERLYREKYGLAHAALGLVRDRADAIAIRLERLPDRGTRG